MLKVKEQLIVKQNNAVVLGGSTVHSYYIWTISLCGMREHFGAIVVSMDVVYCDQSEIVGHVL